MASAGDKTEAPTPKRKREARRDGQIPRTPELTTWGGLLVASWVIPGTVARSAAGVSGMLRDATKVIAEPDVNEAMALIPAAGSLVLQAVAPLALSMLVLGVVGNLAQTGFAVSSKKLKPKADRLNPLKGLKRLVSPESAWQAGKVLVRTGILAGAAWMPMSQMVDSSSSADRPDLGGMIAESVTASLTMIRLVAALGLLLGILDYGFSRFRIGKQLRMTKQEVKDEHRNTEGDPMVRQHVRQRQRQMSRNRMIAAVADSNVVLVNPTHVAVALKYTPGTGAPRVVAKGKGAIAKRIREEAEKHNVTIVRDVPLAWALHDGCQLDQTIPPDLYEAVAKVLAFVMTVGRRTTGFGTALVAR